MNVSAQILEARPDARGVDHALLALAIDALADVVTASTTCADACLSHDDVTSRRDCIRACQDAADVSTATIKVLSRIGPTMHGSRALIDAAAKLLSETETVTAAHGIDDKHCRICAETCARASQTLQSLQTEIAATVAGTDDD